MARRLLLAVMIGGLAGCGASGASSSGDAGAGAGGDDATADGAAGGSDDGGGAEAGPTQGDGGQGDGGGGACGGFPVSLASLTAHDTSAFAAYDQAHFPANFGATTWISQSGTTMPVDPSKADMSLNPVTPGHVSATNVHTLVPSRPDLRWFAHITPWFHPGGPHIDIGLNNDTMAYVQSMVDDMRRRGFDGLIVDWYGQGSFEDQVTLLAQQYIDTLPPGSFSFIVMADKGIKNLSESVLEQQIEYVQKQYFEDPHYELEGGKPILMFFGVDAALGSAAMAQAKAATGGNMVWVTQGTGTLSETWVDQCFDWTHDYHDGPSTTDPYNLAGVKGFYTAVKGSTKKAFGSMVAGFDGTLTRSVSWSEGKYLPRGSGACVVQWAKTIDAVVPPNVTRMQWATWSDWEEGTEIESGVENDVAVTAKVAGSMLGWTVTSGTGDESTIDHYEVYASKDGAHAADLGAVPAGTHAFDLGAAKCLTAGTAYSIEVVAVGKPVIRDHASHVVTYTP